MSRGAGAPPATAHWVADGPPTKVRSSTQASNSAPFRLIIMDLTASRPLSLRFMKRKPDGAFFVNDRSYRKKEQQSLPRFKHIGRGLPSAGRAASCLDGDCATRDAALMAHQMRGARLHGWIVVDMPTVLPGVGHRLGAKTSFIISRRAW